MGKNAAALLDQIEELPPLPAVAMHVMRIADDERTGAMELAHVLSTDQGLTARLIRISNSAYYGFARRVSSVREAVLVLGFKQVRQVAVGASIMQTFGGRREPEAFDLDLFWGHSIAVAVAAETVAKRTKRARPEDAFTAGILHDIGRLALRAALPEAFETAVLSARTGQLSLHAAEVSRTGYAHDELGEALGARWRFPGHLIEAIGQHHNARLNPFDDGLAGVIAQANRLVLHYGLYSGYEVEGAQLQALPSDLAETEALCGGLDQVLARAYAFLEGANGTPEKWYARTG